MEPRLLRFLLVEDDDDHAEIIVRTLRRSNIASAVQRVADADEALILLRQCGQTTTPSPDIILLDLKLPGLSGHDLLRIIKSDPTLLTIPVVVLTTSSAEKDREMAYKHHANSYIVKPASFVRFREMVRDLSLYWGVWSPPAQAV